MTSGAAHNTDLGDMSNLQFLWILFALLVDSGPNIWEIGIPKFNFRYKEIITNMRKISICIPLHSSSIALAVALCVAAASPLLFGGETKAAKTAILPPAIFSTALPDVPGKKLVVVDLTFPPKSGQTPTGGHRHPGSVFVYVTQGIARLGIDGQPIKEVRAGEGFFEPPGALHTVAESASTTQSASAIALMIVPEGSPLLTIDDKKKGN
jgi:quercetin dioxygenase-like cupin family protein